MKVLLTGASGFIGAHLLTYLIERLGVDSVIALTSKKIPNVNSIVYDTIREFRLNKDQFDDVTHVIHAGAFIPKEAQESNNISFCSGNIDYTKELLSFSFRSLVRFINISTVDVYENITTTISEISNVEPVNLYGSSKVYCEAMVKVFSKQRGLDYLNLRIGHVYGPGEEKYKKVLPVSISNILQNKPLELWGDGSELRSFIFIYDVVQAIIYALNSPVKNKDINVVSGVTISIKELLEKIIKVSGKNVMIDQRESNHKKRDLVFDNSLLLSTLLDKETDLLKGLEVEYNYMKEKYESNI